MLLLIKVGRETKTEQRRIGRIQQVKDNRYHKFILLLQSGVVGGEGTRCLTRNGEYEVYN